MQLAWIVVVTDDEQKNIPSFKDGSHLSHAKLFESVEEWRVKLTVLTLLAVLLLNSIQAVVLYAKPFLKPGADTISQQVRRYERLKNDLPAHCTVGYIADDEIRKLHAVPGGHQVMLELASYVFFPFQLALVYQRAYFGVLVELTKHGLRMKLPPLPKSVDGALSIRRAIGSVRAD
jgi:hypothetical protein